MQHLLALTGGGWVGLVIGLLALAAWVWMVFDVIGRRTLSGTAKALWIVVGIFFPLLTVLVYLLVGRRSG
jgi:hypothetical protein